MTSNGSGQLSLCDAGIVSIADAVALMGPQMANSRSLGAHPVNRFSLHGNHITRIDTAPLARLARHLTHLDLSSNKIESMRGVGELQSLVRLNLASNKIQRIEDLAGLVRLVCLELQFNRIASLDGLVGLHGNAYSLEKLDLRCNPVEKEEELTYLAGLTKLRDLVFASPSVSSSHTARQRAPRPTPVSQLPTYRRLIFRILPQLRSLDGTDESNRKVVKGDGLTSGSSGVFGVGVGSTMPGGNGTDWEAGDVEGYEKVLRELEEGEMLIGGDEYGQGGRGTSSRNQPSLRHDYQSLSTLSYPMGMLSTSHHPPANHTFNPPNMSALPTTSAHRFNNSLLQQPLAPSIPNHSLHSSFHPSMFPTNPPSTAPPLPEPNGFRNNAQPQSDSLSDPRLASLERRLAQLTWTLAERSSSPHTPQPTPAGPSHTHPNHPRYDNIHSHQPPQDRISLLERQLAELVDTLDPAGVGRGGVVGSRRASPRHSHPISHSVPVAQVSSTSSGQLHVDRMAKLERRVAMLIDVVGSGTGRRSRRASTGGSEGSGGEGDAQQHVDGGVADEDDEARRFAEWKKRKLKEVNKVRRAGILEATGGGGAGTSSGGVRNAGAEKEREKARKREEKDKGKSANSSKPTTNTSARSAPAAEPPRLARTAVIPDDRPDSLSRRPNRSASGASPTRGGTAPEPTAPLRPVTTPPPAAPPDDTPRLLALLAAEEERIHNMAAELRVLRAERDNAAGRAEDASKALDEAKMKCVVMEGELRAAKEEAELGKQARGRIEEVEGRFRELEGDLSKLKERERELDRSVALAEEARARVEKEAVEMRRGWEDAKIALASLESRLQRAEDERTRVATRILKEREQARIKIAETKKEAQIYRVAVDALQRDIQALRDASAVRDAEHRKRLEEMGGDHAKSLEAALSRTIERLESRHRADRESMSAQLARSREAYTALEEEYRRAGREAEDKAKEVAESYKEAVRVGQERAQLLASAAQEKRETADMVRDLSIMVKEQKTKISELLEKNQTYVTVYEDKIHALEERLRAAQKHRSDLRDSARTVPALQTELNAMRAQLEEALVEKKRLEEELGRKVIFDCENNCRISPKIVVKFLTKTAALEHERGAVEGRFKALEEAKSALERSKEASEQALRVKNKMLDDQNDTIRKMKQTLEEKIRELQAVTTEASKREDRLEEQLAVESRSKRELRMELEKTEKYAEHLQSLADDYKEERDYLRKEASELSRKLKERNESIEKIEEEVSKVRAAFKAKESNAVQEKEVELLSKNAVIANLRTSLETNTTRILEVERERDAVYVSVRKLEADLEAAVQQRDKCEAEMKVLLIEMDRVRKKNEEKMAKLRAAMQEAS
ncbi:hypothetical protein HDU93_006942 [Gonapodya sp. JEL0774]|nr:hypothetical protein HDU93_006942 [Gonapodya sp. JEL0774]